MPWSSRSTQLELFAAPTSDVIDSSKTPVEVTIVPKKRLFDSVNCWKRVEIVIICSAGVHWELQFSIVDSCYLGDLEIS